jgi:uncharacterized protein (DUF885 family)
MNREKILKLSEDYLGFMASTYPVMSLSDEFYFFPRAKSAIQYMEYLDSLSGEKIKQSISYIRTIKRKLEELDTKKIELETQIDVQLLRQSIAGFLREFEQVKIWQSDPNLYLKIIILGIEQIVNKLSMIKKGIQKELTSRIRQVPRLLKEAKVNLKEIPLFYQETAMKLTKVIIDYLKNQLCLSLQEIQRPAELLKFNKAAIQSLEDFKIFLKRQHSKEKFIKDRRILEDLLINSFSYKRGLEEIFDIASWEYQRILTKLKSVASLAHPSRTWQNILSGYKIKANSKKGLLSIYSSQITCLKDFIKKNKLVGIPRMQNIQVKPTPVYLTPIRASASYSCPLSINKKESAFFYVTIDRTWENIHQEYIFVTAHETYPGHHLLDSIRRNIRNPIRQQIESVLFYEGWASYVEGLIEESGYIDKPEQKLVGLRRQAWRAIRAKLDVGIRINKIKLPDVADELNWLGYSTFSIKEMLRHYALTYGYQLCYTIGKFEIERLREEFSSQMGIENFHNHLITEGELPFDLIKKRMQKLCQKNS